MNAGSGSAVRQHDATTAATSSAASTSRSRRSDPNVIYAQVQSHRAAEQHRRQRGCGNANGCQLGAWAIDRRRRDLVVHGRLGRRLAAGLRDSGPAPRRRPGDYPQNWYDQGDRGRPEQPRPHLRRHVRGLARDPHRHGLVRHDLRLLRRVQPEAACTSTSTRSRSCPARRASCCGNDGGVHGTTNADAAALNTLPADLVQHGHRASTRSSSTRATSAATSRRRRARRRPAARRTTRRARRSFPGGADRPGAVAARDRRRRLLRPHRPGRHRDEPALLRRATTAAASRRCTRHDVPDQRRRATRASAAAGPATRSRSSSRSTSSTAAIPGGDDCAAAGTPGGCGHLIARHHARLGDDRRRQRHDELGQLVRHEQPVDPEHDQADARATARSSTRSSTRRSVRAWRSSAPTTPTSGSASTSAPASPARRTGSTSPAATPCCRTGRCSAIALDPSVAGGEHPRSATRRSAASTPTRRRQPGHVFQVVCTATLRVVHLARQERATCPTSRSTR